MTRLTSEASETPTPWFLQSGTRMLASILVILAVPTAILSTLVTFQVRSELRDRAVLQNGLAAQVVARTVDNDLRSLQSYLESFAAQPQVADHLSSGDLKEVQTQLKWLVAQNGRVSRAFIANSQGIEIVDYPHDPSVIGKDFSHRDWFRGVSARNAPYVSGFYRRAAYGQPNIVAIAVPVRGADGKVVGYLVGQYTAADLKSWLWDARPAPDGWVGLVDSEGHYIRSGQLDTDYHEISDLGDFSSALAVGAEWSIVQDPLRNEDVLMNSTPIPSLGWSVIAAQPAKGVFASLRSLLLTILIYFSTCFAGAACLGLLWFRTLKRYDHRRREALAELHEAHGSLERRVEERTSELASANRELARLASIVEFSSDVIICLSLDGTIQTWNAGAERLYGYTEEEMVGKSCMSIVPKDRQEETGELLERLRMGRSVESLETVRRAKDGRRIDVTVSASPIRDASGLPIAAASIARDLTQRKRTERHLKKTLKELAIKNRELQDFAYVASHDLQEPLRKIQAFGSRLQDRAGAAMDETTADYLDRMIKAADRMKTLISDLLSFSRIATRTDPFVPVRLERVVQEVISDLEVRIEQSGATVDIGPLPTIDGDPTQLRQLFQNVIGNALKFSRPNVPPRVSVTSAMPAAESSPSGEGRMTEMVRIEIADNGIGFDDTYKDRIFQPFQRLHGRNEYEGTGIGLAICRRIVERHSGTISASGIVNEGSRFVITLPVSQTNEGADSCESSTPESSSSLPMMTPMIAS